MQTTKDQPESLSEPEGEELSNIPWLRDTQISHFIVESVHDSRATTNRPGGEFEKVFDSMAKAKLSQSVRDPIVICGQTIYLKP